MKCVFISLYTAAEMMINLKRGYMFSGLFSISGCLNHWNISNICRNIAFCPNFTHLSVSFLPWLNLILDLSLFSGSLSLILLWIWDVPLILPNPSVPPPLPPPHFHLCVLLLTGGWGVCWLFFAGWLCFLFLVSIEYQLLSLVRKACQCNKPAVYIYIKAGKHTLTYKQT